MTLASFFSSEWQCTQRNRGFCRRRAVYKCNIYGVELAIKRVRLPDRCTFMYRPLAGCLRMCAFVTKQCNLVQVKWRRCSAKRKVTTVTAKSNGSLLSGLCLITCLDMEISSRRSHRVWDYLYAPDLRREGTFWNDGWCLSVLLTVRMSIACFKLTRERKCLGSSKLARRKPISRVTREPI